MAGGVKLVLAIATLTLGGTAQAQLPDPTRPPVAAAQPAVPGGTASPPASLQSVILRKEGRPAALIDGQLVELGARHGEMRLVLVAEDHVVLLGPQGRETLRLMPAAEKRSKVGAGKTVKPVGLNTIKGETPK